ncbi:MAG: hypothetical protein ACE5FU_09920, partial [Nitrospinota bacterium]
EKKGSKIIVEGPWRFENGVNKLFAYQKIHRQKVKIGFVNGLCSPPRLGEYIASEKFKFSHFIHLKQRDSLLAEKIDYVVFHKNEKITPQLLPDVTECITTYKHWFGAPVFSDAKIEVFKINKKI